MICCDLLKKLDILMVDYLFFNLFYRNLQLLEDEFIPDQLILPSDLVSALTTLPDLEKTTLLRIDTCLKHFIKKLLFKYPEIFSKLPDPEEIDCPPMGILFQDESQMVSKKFRYLFLDKLKVSHEEKDVLVNKGSAVLYETPRSSLICLDQRPGKPVPLNR
ncbi:hypothetical protein P9112_000390 [Eukaryota sp. TZLM1-RC]